MTPAISSYRSPVNDHSLFLYRLYCCGHCMDAAIR